MTRMTGCMGISLAGGFLGSTWILRIVPSAPMILVIPGESPKAATGRPGVTGHPERFHHQASSPGELLPAIEVIAGGRGAAGEVREASRGQ
jgi:hypothetical protein